MAGEPIEASFRLRLMPFSPADDLGGCVSACGWEVGVWELANLALDWGKFLKAFVEGLQALHLKARG